MMLLSKDVVVEINSGGQLIDTFVVGWLDLCFICYLDDAFAAATFVTDIFIETN